MTKNKVIRRIIICIAIMLAIYLASLIRVIIKNKTSEEMQRSAIIDVTSKDFLTGIADNLNKDLELPIMVDDITQLTNVSAEKSKLIYQYVIINSKSDDLQKSHFIQKIQKIITPKVCSNKRLIIHLKEGISYVYSYSDKDNNYVGDFIVTPSDCGY